MICRIRFFYWKDSRDPNTHTQAPGWRAVAVNQRVLFWSAPQSWYDLLPTRFCQAGGQPFPAALYLDMQGLIQICFYELMKLIRSSKLNSGVKT